MSASLVGSEMCIRDSRCRPQCRRRRLRRRGRLRRCGRGCGRRHRCPCPVSYTHLTLPTICSV
eukprot:11540176-Alexandrium_andersonii.AAC.1